MYKINVLHTILYSNTNVGGFMSHVGCREFSNFYLEFMQIKKIFFIGNSVAKSYENRFMVKKVTKIKSKSKFLKFASILNELIIFTNFKILFCIPFYSFLLLINSQIISKM